MDDRNCRNTSPINRVIRFKNLTEKSHQVLHQLEGYKVSTYERAAVSQEIQRIGSRTVYGTIGGIGIGAFASFRLGWRVIPRILFSTALGGAGACFGLTFGLRGRINALYTDLKRVEDGLVQRVEKGMALERQKKEMLGAAYSEEGKWKAELLKPGETKSAPKSSVEGNDTWNPVVEEKAVESEPWVMVDRPADQATAGHSGRSKRNEWGDEVFD
ncbi:MAG: hypothetical protein SGCHY_003732 [Lobulomycetales sp.]